MKLRDASDEELLKALSENREALDEEIDTIGSVSLRILIREGLARIAKVEGE